METAPTTTPSTMEPRTTIAGCWILDKTRENWSMNEYLQTMNVDPLAVEAHEKGEKDFDTFHTIDFVDHNKVRIMKRSRVNNDVCVELILGMESIEYLQPMNRPKCSVATSDHPGHLCIKSSLVTTDHGKAIVTDVKRLQENAVHDPILITNENISEQSSTPVRNDVVLVQELTILNEETGKTHTTTRYFNPYYDTPPHLVPSAVRNMDDVDDDDK
jgi:hypothetical protein